jgi:hypothetical protein
MARVTFKAYSHVPGSALIKQDQDLPRARSGIFAKYKNKTFCNNVTKFLMDYIAENLTVHAYALLDANAEMWIIEFAVEVPEIAAPDPVFLQRS